MATATTERIDDIETFVDWVRQARTLDAGTLAYEALRTATITQTRADIASTIAKLQAADLHLAKLLVDRRADLDPPPDSNGGDPGPEPDPQGGGDAPPPPPPHDPAKERRDARIARWLADLPHTRAAFDAGRLTLDQVTKLVNVAADTRVGPTFRNDETELLAAVLAAGVTKTDQVIRDWRARHGTGSADATARHRQRSVRTWTGDDGFAHLHFTAADEYGANVLAMFRSLRDADWTRQATRTTDGPLDDRTREQRDADTLRWALELALGATTDGQARPTPRKTLLAHVDHDDLIARLGGTASRSGTPLTGDDIRRLCCEAGIARIVTNGDSVPLDKGRATRFATPAQRQALSAIYGSCGRPGCNAPFWTCHIHHINEFAADTGNTDLADLIPLCSTDHDQIHHHGHHIEHDQTTGGLVWVTGDGTRHPIAPDPPNQRRSTDPPTAADPTTATPADPLDPLDPLDPDGQLGLAI